MNTRQLAVVTGSSSGIGLAIAQHLLAGNWRVLGISRTPAPIKSEHYEHLALDLAQTASLAQAMSPLHVNAVVHAAGFMRVGRVGELDDAALEAMWRVHVLAAESMVNALVPGMTENGRIVLIGSRASLGLPNRSQYGATKAALVAMARAWASELASRRITCNVVSPAATVTPMLSDASRIAELPKLPPIGRYISAEEVSAAVGFLLSDQAGAITGQQLIICGGSSL